MLTPAQLQTLKADIAADPVLSAKPMNSDGSYDIAAAYNASAAPAFTVWRTNVSLKDVGEAMNSSEVAGLTTGNTSRLQVMAQFSGGTFNPSRTDTRAGFDSVFNGAGGANTRAALLVLWKRAATRAEKLFASGTGSDATPATLGWEGTLSYQDVDQARAL
jgi:hypothetical protein